MTSAKDEAGLREGIHSAGFVLVGGQSSRMGRDKGLLPTASGPLVKEIADSVAAVTDGNTALVGRPELYRGLLRYDCLEDVHPGYGPLSGIHAALKSGRGDYNLILACDMPGIDRKLLTALLDCARARGTRCVVPVDTAGQIHPLCAVYHRSALETVERAICSSRKRLLDLLGDLDAFFFEIPLAIRNCNRPADWAAFQRV